MISRLLESFESFSNLLSFLTSESAPVALRIPLMPSRCRALAKSPTDTLAHAVPELLSCMLQVMVPPVAAGNCR